MMKRYVITVMMLMLVASLSVQAIPYDLDKYPWLDKSKSFHERAVLLVKELTLREKVDQLGNNVSEPIKRDGEVILPAYQYWNEALQEVASNETFGQLPATGKRIMVEFSSPNTNKPLHLGHIRNNLLGDSVSRILKACGNEVIKSTIVNDRGVHICKSMYAWEKLFDGKTPESTGIKGDHLVGDCYVAYAKMEKEHPEVIDDVHKMLVDWEAGDPHVRALWEMMNGWVYKGFDETYKALGITFDQVDHESETYLLGKELVQKGLREGVFVKEGPEVSRPAARLVRAGRPVLHQLPHGPQRVSGPRVVILRVLAAHEGEQQDFLPQVVESDDLVEEHQIQVPEAFRIVCVQGQGRLRVLDIIVGPIPHETSREGRQGIQARAPVFRGDTADRLAGMTDRFRGRPSVPHGQDAVAAGQFQLRVVSQKGVPTPLLAVFHRLQEKRVAAGAFQPAQHFNGRYPVRIELTAHRHGPIPLGREGLHFVQPRLDSHDVPPYPAQWFTASTMDRT